MVENLRRRGVNTFGQLKIYKENNISLEAFQLWNSFPIYWRSLAGRSRRWDTYVDPDFKYYQGAGFFGCEGKDVKKIAEPGSFDVFSQPSE